MDLVTTRFRGWLLLAAALVPFLVSGLLALVRDQTSAAVAVLVLVVLVVAASATGDRWAGLIAAVSAGLGFDLFLVPPYGTLAISNPADVETVVLLVAVGVGVTELALWGRRHQAQASRNVGYLDGVLSAAETVASRDAAADDLVALVGSELTTLLGLDACRFTAQAPQLRTVVEPGGTVRRGSRELDVERHGLPTDEEVLLPVRHRGHTIGAFVLTTATRVRRPSREQLRVAVLLADQVGTAVVRRAAHDASDRV